MTPYSRVFFNDFVFFFVFIAYFILSPFINKIIPQDDRTRKILLKTVLDTFFVPFYCTKNTRTDGCDNYTQRGFVVFL